MVRFNVYFESVYIQVQFFIVSYIFSGLICTQAKTSSTNNGQRSVITAQQIYFSFVRLSCWRAANLAGDRSFKRKVTSF